METTTQSTGSGTALRFRTECTENDISPCVPDIEGMKYDVLTECDGFYRRVQIKHAFIDKNDNRTFICEAYSRSNNKNAMYTSKDIDIIATYVKEHKAWYLFPVALIDTTKKRPRFRLRPGCDNGPWLALEQYRDAWHLLKPRATREEAA